MEDAEFVANTIRDQIRAVDYFGLWAWGAQNMKVIPEGLCSLGYIMGGLSFSANGLKFIGIVKITLMPCDTYTIQIGQEENEVFVPKETKENVFCDELVSVIDNLIEYDT